MKEFENIQNITDSIGKLKKHLEKADYLISYLEADLDECGAYRYVDSEMLDIKNAYKQLLDYVDTLNDDLDDVINDD